MTVLHSQLQQRASSKLHAKNHRALFSFHYRLPCPKSAFADATETVKSLRRKVSLTNASPVSSEVHKRRRRDTLQCSTPAQDTFLSRDTQGCRTRDDEGGQHPHRRADRGQGTAGRQTGRSEPPQKHDPCRAPRAHSGSCPGKRRSPLCRHSRYPPAQQATAAGRLGRASPHRASPGAPALPPPYRILTPRQRGKAALPGRRARGGTQGTPPALQLRGGPSPASGLGTAAATAPLVCARGGR